MRSPPSSNHYAPPCGTVTPYSLNAQKLQKRLRHYSHWGTTYYFGHKFVEVEAVFGHHGTQDLSDWFGWFGFQPHRAVYGN